MVAHCQKGYEWDRSKVVDVFEVAKKENVIDQAGKDNLRIMVKGHELLECPSKSGDINVKDQHFEGGTYFDSDYVDFLKYMHAEVILLKARLTKRTIAEYEKNLQSSVDYEKDFILRLRDRIVSLEQQLEQKQKIIEKLMEENKYSWPSHTDSKALKEQAFAGTLGNKRNNEDPRLMASSNQQKGKKPPVNLPTGSSNNDEPALECIRKASPEKCKQRNRKKQKKEQREVKKHQI